LFAIGFAPAMQQTWREGAAASFLGAVMGLLFVAADRVGGLRVLLPDGLLEPSELAGDVFVFSQVVAGTDRYQILPCRLVTGLGHRGDHPRVVDWKNADGYFR
jgi:hypothetical protein